MKKVSSHQLKLLSVMMVIAILFTTLIPSTALAAKTADSASYQLTTALGNYVYADAVNSCYYVLTEDKLTVVDAESGTSEVFYDFKAKSSDPDNFRFCDFYASDDTLYYLYQCGSDSVVCVINFPKFSVFKNTLRFACTSVMCTKSGDILVYSPLNSGMVFVVKANGTTDYYKISSPILDFYGEDTSGNIYYRQSHGVTYAAYDGNSFTESNRRLTDFPADTGSRSMPIEIFDNRYIADYRGNLYTLDNGNVTKVLQFNRKGDTKSPYPVAGTAMLLIPDTHYVIGLGGNNEIETYDLTTGQKISSVSMDHRVHSLCQFGPEVIVLEQEKKGNYCELYYLGDLAELEPEVIDLNTQSVYANRSAAEVAQRYSGAIANYSLSRALLSDKGSDKVPYAASVMSNTSQKALLSFSNYQRWLAGLTPYQTGDASAKDCASKGAVLLAASPVQGHYPPKPNDMANDFYDVAYKGTGGNLAYHPGIKTVADGITAIRGLTNDTENLSNKEQMSDDGRYYQGYNTPGHRNTFLQRGGQYVTYGAANGILVQYYEYAQDDPNQSGTIAEVNNNQNAYAWPAPGAFPLEEIDVHAVWTVNLNTDVVNTGSKDLNIIITDLTTGEKFVRNTVMHDKDGQREGYSLTNYWGKVISFTPPKTDSYQGKSYRVTIENLINQNGMPVSLTYTINMLSYSDTFTIDSRVYQLDENGNLVPATQPTEPTATTEPTLEPTNPSDIPTDPTDVTDPTFGPTAPSDTPTDPTDATDPTFGPTAPSDVPTDPTNPTEPSNPDPVTFLVGDVNNDGKVNGADSGILSRYTSGWKNYESKIINRDAADINRDGKINGADSGLLSRYTSGWKTVLKYFILISI